MAEKALQKANVKVFLNSRVEKVGSLENGDIRIWSSGEGNNETYDYLVIATPLEISGAVFTNEIN